MPKHLGKIGVTAISMKAWDEKSQHILNVPVGF